MTLAFQGVIIALDSVVLGAGILEILLVILAVWPHCDKASALSGSDIGQVKEA